MNILHLLAQMTQTATQPAPKEPLPWWANSGNFIFPLLIGLLAFMLLTSSRTKKAEERKRDAMIRNLKRGDRVMTIGGMHGTVVDVRESEVVLKVDESANTKIRFTRDAVKRVLADDEDQGK